MTNNLYKLNIMIVIWGMFKVGSETIYNTLLHYFPTLNIKKMHTNLDLLKSFDNLETVIIPIRKDKIGQYMSAYFMDIVSPEYPYSPFNRRLSYFKNLDEDYRKELILVTDTQILINDFNSIDWEQYEWLNLDISYKLLCHGYNIDVSYADLEKLDDILFTNGTERNTQKKINFIFITTEKINEENLKQITNFCQLSKVDDIKVLNSNIGINKWYGEKYQQFKKIFYNQVL